MVSVNELLEKMDALIDRATSVPLSGGKVMVNANELRDMIDDIRLHLPQEIREAQNVVAKRNDIISQARKEAEGITRKAEDKARQLISEQDVSKRAKIQANELVSQAQTKARDIRRGATDYAESIIRAAEDVLSEKLTELRQSRQDLRGAARKDTTIPAQLPIAQNELRDEPEDEREYSRAFDIPVDDDAPQGSGEY